MSYDLNTDYLTPTQAGHVIGVSAKRVMQLCDAERLAHVRTPLGRLILRISAEDYAKGRRESLRANFRWEGEPAC